jgi:hypothetical protein
MYFRAGKHVALRQVVDDHPGGCAEGGALDHLPVADDGGADRVRGGPAADTPIGSRSGEHPKSLVADFLSYAS